MEPTLALYRRYRPETFAEVIGQDHVTEPLRAALANNRVNHAYLFSGPRGCGKTTSARILARALNCEKAPIADPCGECQSCRDLARGGPGSIDVIEIDAASHGGVDDARDLRERAFFAPVSSRYKVYIIDEAHMVSTQGFNALLKLVEEPPEHLRFIFATTEPEKVIATIRSRTHHYPFRLIPPRTLSDYLAQICEQEGVQIDPAALPLVVRAGAGSARDSLSVLDQLLGGAGPDGVTYDVATNLLGYTPDNLLDEVVDAFAAADGAGVFGVVDKVIETGQDPRRFTEDVLRRLRDLVIVAAVPDAPASGLIDAPAGPGRAAGRAGRPVRQGRAGACRRHRGSGTHRDAGGHDSAAAAGADLCAGAAAGGRPRLARARRSSRSSRASVPCGSLRRGRAAAAAASRRQRAWPSVAPTPAAPAAQREGQSHPRSLDHARADSPGGSAVGPDAQRRNRADRPARVPTARGQPHRPGRAGRSTRAEPRLPRQPRSPVASRPVASSPLADRPGVHSRSRTCGGSGRTCSRRSRRCGGSPGSCSARTRR